MLVFFGTSPRSAKFLELAIENELKVGGVVSEPPKPIGKKQVLIENPTVSFAKEKGIPVYLSLSDLGNLGNLSLGLMLDFNKIIPEQIIDLFPQGILNLHFSKLPQYRGPAPVQYTILNGDKEAWITYLLIDKNLDAGKIITQTSLPLDLTENTESLYQKAVAKAASEISAVTNDYLSNKIQPSSQEGIPSSTKKLTVKNCKIDWTRPPEQNERLIRAAYPEPGAWTNVNIKYQMSNVKTLRLKILKAHLKNKELILDQVQLEGKNPVTWKQFQEGYPTSTLS
jgi:methionyl-tRNA formyltransferase